MLLEYIEKMMQKAQYKILKDGMYYGEISGLKGVWASHKNLEGCRKELIEVLEDWIFLKLRDGEAIPGLVLVKDLRQRVNHA